MKLIVRGIKSHLILRELSFNDRLWDKHKLRTGYEGSPHAGCSDIWVRYRPVGDYGVLDPSDFCNTPYEPEWWPAADKLPATKKIIEKLSMIVDAESVGACILTKIPPGGQVKLHHDMNYNSQYFLNKYLLVIQSDPRQIFHYNGKDYETANGEAYLWDNRLPHAVYNNSDIDRISLIVSIKQVGQKPAWNDAA